nr:PREDICTED: uncharacterized protein LOC105661951 [Megachile rotundata]
MQQLWQLQTNWDESVPQDVYKQWIDFITELEFLDKVKIPRRVIVATGRVEVIGFSDASEKAFGACVYLRSCGRSGQWDSRLLLSKSRVAPLKTITLLRLEFCGALLLAKLIKKNWFHVWSFENPADLITRGSTPKLLAINELWWSGPGWLKSESDLWPQSLEEIVNIPDQKKSIVSVNIVTFDNNDLIERYSDIDRLLRVTAYCLRFINNARKPKTNKSTALGNSQLSVIELQEAQQILIRVVQKAAFPNEFIALNKNQSVQKQSPLQALAPFLDETDIIRIGGRLSNAPIKYSVNITDYFTRVASKSSRHCANTIGQSISQPTGSTVPYGSVTDSQGNTCTTIRYLWGRLRRPIFNKERSHSKTSIKSYICIFVCFAIKAIHIELAIDISGKNRLADLEKLITSEQHNSEITKFLSGKMIQWHLIPPQAPHFGGLWESAVRSTKSHLNKVIGKQKLTYEELYTLLAQIESCLNSRPLSPISSDPYDLNPLTLGHFLTGIALCALPEENLIECWYKEYLHNFQQRYKWKHATDHHLIESSLVVIKEDNLPPLRRCLGRVTEVHQGKDGEIRVVTIRTATGTYKRPVTKICILSIYEEEDTNTTK